MERFREAGRINRMQFTARRQKLRDLCAVFLFLFLLPYACSLIFGGEDACRETLAVPASEGPMVACDGKAGTLLLPLEEYVEGALAASIPPEYEMETLKAQAVILRTLCLKAGETAEVISAASVGQRYLDAEQRRILWGEDYEEKQSRMEEAVRQTEGLVLTCGGELLEPAYFQLSAGKTRDGKEVLGEGYEYLVSVDCSHDVEAEDYSQSVVLSEERFRRTLGCGSEGKILLTRDSADYVLYVDTEAGRMSGESFRDLFGLSSSCFVLEQEGDSIRLTSRGIGHGLGFCQNEADRRAAQGEDYIELLSDFFKGAKIRKI